MSIVPGVSPAPWARIPCSPTLVISHSTQQAHEVRPVRTSPADSANERPGARAWPPPPRRPAALPASRSFPPLPPCFLSTVSPDGPSQTLSPQAPFISASVILPFKSHPETVGCVLKVFTFHQLLSALLHFRVLTLTCLFSGTPEQVRDHSRSPRRPPVPAPATPASTDVGIEHHVLQAALPGVTALAELGLPLGFHDLPSVGNVSPPKALGSRHLPFP